MEPVKLKAFFSCSFEKEDEKVFKYFHSICKGMDIECVNVGQAYSETPPVKARELISHCGALIAIATKRAERKNGKFDMPSAVSDEIAMAFALKKPILLAVEEGVSIDEGFKKGYCTHITFKRRKLDDPAFVEGIISSIYQFKIKYSL